MKIEKTIEQRLTLSTEKGGVGKTAIAVNLARYFAGHGKKTLVVDLDVQGNATDALADCPVIANTFELMNKDLKDRNIEADGDLFVIKADPRLADLESSDVKEVVQKAEENFALWADNFDLIIFDTPPTLGSMLVTALMLSRKIVIPIEVEPSSIAGANNVCTTIVNLKNKLGGNPKLDLLGFVINKMQHKPRQLKNLEELRALQGFGKLLVPNMIYNRDAVAQALADHCSLKEVKKTAARKAYSEFNKLGEFFMAKLF